MLLTEVPDAFIGRGYPPAQTASGFSISLDTAEPWGGGRVVGRVERRKEGRDERPITVTLRCDAAWLDIAPQLVGQKSFLNVMSHWDLRTRGIPVWLDESAWSDSVDVGGLDDANWRHFEFSIPEDLPRAFEGTFVSFRWRIVASRARRVGRSESSLPLILREPLTIPCTRVETSSLGTWRVLEWKSTSERDGSAASCSVRYEARRPDDAPHPGETREEELARRSR